ncbi:hypothetical protein MGG_05982 [Pyricularia oryzae 70-15]|uniref:Uncharacterized protein n=4 Tax=Pyricularia oryzae TaxID=318829 RepID=G4N4K5_PYRO7|nr:uncharacterized protein MGG_05982 [Pyricularia oryzae 70-15]ELQ33171.1 hypothetical protein OOU_Y34scaffold00995g25 [Pyricularia oryzae Y34]KAI6310472.1 hypothetical protein MCOR34_006376 [Pyricularia oryzae]EHA52020.1 hypothetical protein MGG_05982 [Pyricularia oryzae 70-15]KAI6477840.1 hypothetical protein MCOR17_000331 [Pyricularia oryzae]KAI6600424.1 hypothetical protein MCOR04_002246 [Pyricularia oryzae]
MKLFTIIMATAAAFSSTVTAAPVESTTRSAAAFDAWFEGWSGKSFTGYKKRYEVQWDVCHDIRADFPPGTGDGLSTMNIGDQGVTECTIYNNPNCNIRPGEDRDWGDRLQCSGVYTDLDDPEIGWGNKAQSFKCYRVR